MRLIRLIRIVKLYKSANTIVSRENAIKEIEADELDMMSEKEKKSNIESGPPS